MPLFTPPTTDGIAIARPGRRTAADMLWRHYGSWSMGKTVWRDALGGWHEAIWPYQGGGPHRTFDDGALVSETFEDGVNLTANAQTVYQGGHVYQIDQTAVDDLTAAVTPEHPTGFGEFINTEPVTLTWHPDQLAQLERRIMSADLPNISQVTVEANQGVFTLASGNDVGSSQLREFWLHDHTSGWTDVEVTCAAIDPPHFGSNYQGMGIDVLPQGGVVLRVMFDGSKWRGVTLNNNVIFGIPSLNVGVWEAFPDGTGFANRQFGWNLFEAYPLPYGFTARLEGTVVTVSIFRKDGNILLADPTKTKVIDLETDAGNAALIPTPTGEGTCGLISAHLGTSPLIKVRLARTDFVEIT